VVHSIEYYQREYAWGVDEAAVLITDLVTEFERAAARGAAP
jgi:uncharacterized protein with ParB-like and HNH nuclease domain